MNKPRLQAILLLGPTGSGKTPLGDWLAAHGLWGKRCHHFDFGANLRAVATGTMTGSFTPDELRFIQDVLEKGALLENQQFYLATKVLHSFVARRGLLPNDLLILNGLPRHSGQAAAMDRQLDIVALVNFECPDETARHRIRHNTGGDRASRKDDTDDLLQRKLATFAERTRALLAHYRQRGVPIIPIQVRANTQPPEIAGRLEKVGLRSRGNTR